ncbi:MAG: hypothetical protein KIS95_13020 [Anaerolineae bacterium]|uniref:hypothetical protein n=1 Tax=Promineifilum sp. TaxID=2664178 RepID=UPI001D730AD5|nr:hypothetical protein [Anaerolineales bacterium]MCB8936055.1 hypothetical protein [Promineifilum sp.]MCO5181358.1 hypothetical protein [Promineifilum sp.]MCW5848149.1 hypothetical protein [Anaerolineae bacterium]
MDEEDKPTEPDAPQTDPPAAVQWMMQQAAAGQSTALLPPDWDEWVAAGRVALSADAALAARRRRIDDALRGNDRLTEGLPGEAAEALLALGLALARDVIDDTAGLDDATAEDILQPRVRAVRRLMMAATQAARPDAEPPGVEEWLKQAAVALGDRFRPPNEADAQAWRQQWAALAGQPAQQMALLRPFIEQLRTRRS